MIDPRTASWISLIVVGTLAFALIEMVTTAMAAVLFEPGVHTTASDALVNAR